MLYQLLVAALAIFINPNLHAINSRIAALEYSIATKNMTSYEEGRVYSKLKELKIDRYRTILQEGLSEL